MTKAVETVIKTDGLGRIRTSAVRRENLLDEFERSGVSGTKFAALAGIKYQTFAGWVQRRQRQRGVASKPAAVPVSSASVKWLEAVVEQAQDLGGPGSKVLVLQLPGGARVEISDLKQAALAGALVRALAPSC
jgi:hypothetical protein